MDIAVSAVGTAVAPPFIHILFLNPSGSVKERTRVSNGVGGLASTTATLGLGFGQRMAGIGDVDGDGNMDLAVAEKGASRVHILMLNADGSVKAQTFFEGPDVGQTGGDFGAGVSMAAPALPSRSGDSPLRSHLFTDAAAAAAWRDW